MEPIQKKRVYQQIAEQLFRLIDEDEFAVGEKLPGEYELARQLGVSRPSVREALIVLEAVGAIEVVNGAGSFVRQAAKSYRSFPWSSRDTGPGPLEQFRARYLLEPELAAEATRFVTDAEIAVLEEIVERIDRHIVLSPTFSSHHVQFHETVAAAARNPFLTKVLQELLSASRMGTIWKSVRARIDTLENLKKGQQSRKRLLEAMKRRDGNAARRILRSHLMRIGRTCFGDEFERVGSSIDGAPADAKKESRDPDGLRNARD